MKDTIPTGIFESQSSGTSIQEAIEVGDKCHELLCAIVDFLKKEKEHEGTTSVASPSEILDRIFGLASSLPDIKERILK